MVHAKDGTRTFMLPISQKLWEQGFNILLFDMRGEGQSDGERVSYGQYEQYDVLGATNYVKSNGFKPGSIGVVGWSMGATAAILAMSQTGDIKAGVADSSFADFERLANERFSSSTGLSGVFFPGITTAARLLLNIDVSKASPEAAIKNLSGKLFLIHGTKDAEIPVHDFDLLVQAGGKIITESWLVEGSEHVRSFRDHPIEYVQRVTAFFNRELN
jgi:dipeptidyl aminopeptidase/acylaminoacyl peptidase